MLGKHQSGTSDQVSGGEDVLRTACAKAQRLEDKSLRRKQYHADCRWEQHHSVLELWTAGNISMALSPYLSKLSLKFKNHFLCV